MSPLCSIIKPMRIIFYILLIFLVFYLILSFFTQSGKNEDNNSETEMVKDPNCEVYIRKSEAFRRYVKGNYYYFCSSKCLKKFKKK